MSMGIDHLCGSTDSIVHAPFIALVNTPFNKYFQIN